MHEPQARDEQPLPFILHLSIHGLIRGHELELGRDADTGGQTKYVLDLARALARREDIGRVVLVTRRVQDARVSADYARQCEPVAAGLEILRVEAGPEGYIVKEQLWDHLDTFTDNLMDWLKAQPQQPSVIHSHYADAGYVGVSISRLLGIPLVHTGHSLGRDKLKRLLAKGLEWEDIESTYNMARRIDAEEEVLANADLVVSSTRNEIEEQYALYDFYNPKRMSVIPPGTDLTLFHPDRGDDPEPFAGALRRFLAVPDKPIILALSRPDERKNLLTLTEAYGESLRLQELANLVIVAGNRDDIREMDPGARAVLTNILILIDRYDLYGKVAVPKKHRPEEVPAIYRYVAATRGVFVNPALTEPFGLTLLEAAGTGLPVVATENGGPTDIIANCRNGTLVDPLDKPGITRALVELLSNRQAWTTASRNGLEGVARHYSWESHTDRYLEAVGALAGQHSPLLTGERAAALRVHSGDRAIFIELDQAVGGDREHVEALARALQEHRKYALFGIVTGRRLDAALSLLKQYGLPMPNVLITDLGTRIHYGQELLEDEDWADHIRHQWNRQRTLRTLAEVPGLTPQPQASQSPVKLSWYVDPECAPSLEEINSRLRQRELTTNAFFTFDAYLDVVPARASKGQALRHAVQRLALELDRVLVAGVSAADEDMLAGNTLGVVLADPESGALGHLAELERVFVSDYGNARGVLDGISHYAFFDQCAPP